MKIFDNTAPNIWQIGSISRFYAATDINNGRKSARKLPHSLLIIVDKLYHFIVFRTRFFEQKIVYLPLEKTSN